MKKQNLVKIIRAIGGITAYGLILIVFLVICGCGSDSKPSKQQVSDKGKPVLDKSMGSPKVVEIPQGKEPLTGKTVQEEGKISKLPTKLDMDDEVIPPTTPGGKGVTRREAENLQKQQPKIDPLDQEVIPPTKPGEKGMTLREVENLRKLQPQIDPLDQEVIPPTKPGGKGMTLREVEQLRALQSQSPEKPIDPFPPSSPGPNR